MFAMLASLAAPLACASAAGSSAREAAPTLVIKGELSYRLRIALPPDSQASVELREAAGPDAPVVAEQRIDLDGRQVPIAFELAVDRAKLDDTKRYALRGRVFSDGRPAWASESVTIEAASGALDVGTLLMTQVPAETSKAFRAQGNEPGWRLDIEGSQMTLVTQNGERIVAATPSAQRSDGFTRYATRAEGRELTATIFDQTCKDSMTGMPHPSAVEVVLGGQKLSGCGGEPATLLQGPEWVVEDINGTGLVEHSRATLEFRADGRVGGRSSCNTYGAEYTLTGEGLSVSKAAGTMMACPPELMRQEALFLDVLQNVRRFDLSPDGALILETDDRRTLTARR